MTNECWFCNGEEKAGERELGWPVLRNLELASLGWLVLFGIGGLILSLYYANIGYFPQIEWKESLVYLGVMAMTGFFLMLLFSLLLYYPGVLWCKFLFCEPSLKKLFFYNPPDPNPNPFCKPRSELCLRTTLVYIALPFFFHMSFLHTILNCRQLADRLKMPLSFVPLILSFALFWALLRQGLKSPVSCKPPKWLNQDLVRHAGFFLFSSVLSFFSVWVINRLLVASPVYHRLAIACTITVVVVNVFVALTHSTERRTALGIAVAGAFALVIFGDLLVERHDARFSVRLLSRYGIGFHNPAILVVTQKGCELLTSHTGDLRNCSKVDSWKFERVEILSRLGPEYFLSLDGRTLTLPQNEVSSWSTLDKTKVWSN